jgi:Cu/Ag efflux protein CusF
MLKITKLVLASAAAFTLATAVYAQTYQTTGRIIKIDTANSKITLEHKQAGTVGAAAAKDLVDEYKLGKDLAIESFKPGDQVVYTESQVGGVWTVTRIQKQ